ncbi:hypothetical protein BDR07DRAFT_1187526, partial [Suillus spraguei]
GFLHHFVAWVIEDDLPWMTGETLGIIRLFSFLQRSDGNYQVIPLENIYNTQASAMTHYYIGCEIEDCLLTGQLDNQANVFTFARTIASFINDEWELCERLVDFHHIEDKEH